MIIYKALLLLLSPAILLHLGWRAWQCRQWRYLLQRAGLRYDAVPAHCTWFHCASVGEVKTLLPLLQVLHRRAPAAEFLVTSNTATSREVVLRHDQPWLHHLYCPLDWKFAVRVFLRHARPQRCVLFETELWPNLVTTCCSTGILVSIINGRLSDQSMRRAGLLRRVYRAAFDCIGHVYTRNDEDRRRYIALGADAASTETVGDLKLTCNEASTGPRQQQTARDYILVVSTHEDEEVQIARHCATLLQDTLFVIAPRHPERGNAVAGQLRAMGLDVAVHSKQDEIGETTRVYLLDAIGLLDEWFAGALCVVMGGSFVAIGGHNIIEPMVYARAVVYGPSMHNFIEMDELVQQHEAAAQVADYAALNRQLADWLADAAERQEFEQRAGKLTAGLHAVLDHYADRLQ